MGAIPTPPPAPKVTARYDRPLCVARFAFDPQAVGEEETARLTALIARARGGDEPFQLAPGELAVLLPETDEAGAECMATRVAGLRRGRRADLGRRRTGGRRPTRPPFARRRRAPALDFRRTMSGHVGFSIQTSEAGDGLVVRPFGELDLATAPELERLVLGRLEEGRPVVLDLRGLEFMDSSGVRVLVAANARSESEGGPLRIVRPEPGSPVERILVVSGIDRALPFVDEVDELT